MPTPYDAPYKVQQRELRARAKPRPARILVDAKGCIVNPDRRAKKARAKWRLA